MKLPGILAAGLTAMVAAPAMAGGAAQPAPGPVTLEPPPIVSATNWTGPSVGIQLGYGDISTTGGDGDDVLYGLRAYYDYDFGTYIVGGGIQYDAADIDIGGAATLDSITRVGVRAGIDLTNNWIYGTAGWALTDTSDPAIGDSDGWFAGVGYEVFVADNITIGAEILYHEFDDFDLAGFEAEATTASVSVNYRF